MYTKEQLEETILSLSLESGNYIDTLQDEAEVEHARGETLDITKKMRNCIFQIVKVLGNIKATCTASTSTSQTSQMLTRLPQMELPGFDGTSQKWPVFWDHFQAIVHTRTDVADVAKLNYLRAQLTGTASQLIEGLNATGANYKVAVDLVKETYKHPARTIRSVTRTLLEMRKPNYTSMDMLTFKVQLESTLRILQNMNYDITGAGWLLTEIITGKLPTKALE